MGRIKRKENVNIYSNVYVINLYFVVCFQLCEKAMKIEHMVTLRQFTKPQPSAKKAYGAFQRN